ncbi:MAG: HAMP domain-containing sensor histidine kinase [Nitriliruptoraceae bacterium]
MSEIETRLGREMALVTALLYGSGATLVLVTLLVPHWDGLDVAVVGVMVALGCVTAVVHLAMARWWRPPLAWFSGASALGTVLIGVAVVAAGPQGASTYAILYVYVTAFAFYYYSLRLALAHVTFVAITLGVAFAVLDHPSAPAEWIVVVGASVVAGGIIGRLGQRARELHATEERALIRLREVDAMKSLFLQTVSHELRTPLTAVKGGIETLLQDDRRITQDVRTQIEVRIQVNASRLERLVSDLLEVGSLGSGTTQLTAATARLDELVREVVAGLDGGGVRVALHAEPVLASFDANLMARVIDGIVGNALKHTPADVGVTVTVSRSSEEAQVVVDDEGLGIPDEHKARVFEPLNQGPDVAALAQPGVGLGLALAARYVDLHGGRVVLEDRPGGGLRVRIMLPLGDVAATT